MGKKVSNRCFRDPTAEAFFRKEGIEDIQNDRIKNRRTRKIVIKEASLGRTTFSPFYDSRSTMS